MCWLGGGQFRLALLEERQDLLVLPVGFGARQDAGLREGIRFIGLIHWVPSKKTDLAGANARIVVTREF
jgi:hypothetical protein